MPRPVVQHPRVTYRQSVEPTDREVVREITRTTGVFSSAEVEIAVELVETRLQQGLPSGYFFWFAEQGDIVLGYTCFGPIPATVGSFDLYWIAVRPELHGQGIGAGLLRRTENTVRQQGGRRLYVETSSLPSYGPAHAFYRTHGYEQAACLEDYYGPGDAKVIYVKVFPDVLRSG